MDTNAILLRANQTLAALRGRHPGTMPAKLEAITARAVGAIRDADVDAFAARALELRADEAWTSFFAALRDAIYAAAYPMSGYGYVAPASDAGATKWWPDTKRTGPLA